MSDPISNPFAIRRSEGTVPTRVIGGTPIPPAPLRVQCPAIGCPESFAAPLELLAHLSRCVKRAAA